MSDEDDVEELDPRVQVELENLNVCTDEINRLEVQLDESNAQFRSALTECTHRLKCIAEKLGSCVDKAKPYYAAVEQTKKEHLECQKAAVQFQRAVSLHSAAKERIGQAERRFQNASNDSSGDRHFDVVWQDMLNHDTAKLTTAELQRRESEEEHRQRAALFANAVKTTQNFERKLRSAIAKSKPYFEYKALFENDLKLLKERVHSLQKAVVEAKERYAQALRNLERISEEIHEKRKGTREPGVGAETTPESPGLEMEPSFFEGGRQPMNTLEWDYEWESNSSSKFAKPVDEIPTGDTSDQPTYYRCFPIDKFDDSKEYVARDSFEDLDCSNTNARWSTSPAETALGHL